MNAGLATVMAIDLVADKAPPRPVFPRSLTVSDIDAATLKFKFGWKLNPFSAVFKLAKVPRTVKLACPLAPVVKVSPAVLGRVIKPLLAVSVS